MLTKTIKLKPGEYTDLNEMHELFRQHDVVITTGARGGGKSYPCAHFISDDILLQDDTSKFIYMRCRNDELATFASWCTDLNLYELSLQAASYRFQRGRPTKGDICLIGENAEGMQISERVIGKCVSLESAHDFKSGKYDEYKAIVFEEFSRADMNPRNEKKYVRNFLENVESIFRKRPKKIFLLANNFKTIPLLEQSIEKYTGRYFESPIKIKIFRQGSAKENDDFMAYLDGEIYDDDDFVVNIDEFFPLYSNKEYVIYQHKVMTKKHYVTANKNEFTINYRELEYLNLKYFCQNVSTNEFYYQTTGIEKSFVLSYAQLIAEITRHTAIGGSRFIM